MNRYKYSMTRVEPNFFCLLLITIKIGVFLPLNMKLNYVLMPLLDEFMAVAAILAESYCFWQNISRYISAGVKMAAFH